MGRRKRAAAAAIAASKPAVKPAADSPWQRPAIDKTLFIILCAAALVRGAFLVASRESPGFQGMLLDPWYYQVWAKKILTGNVDGVFHGLPLYPFFLAGVFKFFGETIGPVRVLQALGGCATVYFIYAIAERIHSRAAARLSAGFAAVYGPLFFHEALLIPESLGVPIYAASILAAMRLWDAPSPKRGAVAGLLFGLATLVKAGMLGFAAVFFALLAATRRSSAAVKATALGALFLIATLAPVTAHNYFRGHDKVFLTSHGGFNLYIGNNPQAEGVFNPPEGIGGNVDSQIEDTRNYAEKALGRPLKPSEVSKYWSDKAKAYIAENPKRFVVLCARKFLILFDRREISDLADYVFEREFIPMLRFPWPNFAWLAPFTVLGLLAVAWRRCRYRTVLYGFTLTYIGGVLLFFVNDRYRLPLLPVFIPIAAAAAVEFWRSAQAKQWTLSAVYAAALAAGGALMMSELVGIDLSKNWVNTGDVYLMKKEKLLAVRYYQKALEIDPHYPKAHLALGLVYFETGDTDKAKEHLEKSLRGQETPQALINLGLVHNKQGDDVTAEKMFLRAVELKPDSPQGYNNLGMIYGNRKQSEKALAMFQKSLELNPRSARALTNYGLLLYRMGRPVEARAHWEKALEADPAFEEARRHLQQSAAAATRS